MLGAGEGLVVVVAQAATMSASETRSAPRRARTGLFMCGPRSSRKSGARPSSARWAEDGAGHRRGSRPPLRAMDLGGAYGMSTFVRSVPL